MSLMAEGRYWIYDDPATNRAKVHRHDCGFCNDGIGRKGEYGPRLMNDEWIGPFLDRKIAFYVLDYLGRGRDSRGCGHCKP